MISLSARDCWQQRKRGWLLKEVLLNYENVRNRLLSPTSKLALLLSANNKNKLLFFDSRKSKLFSPASRRTRITGILVEAIASL
jgi:hypothetical protein